MTREQALEAALRKCVAELHNYHSIAGDEALDAADDALSIMNVHHMACKIVVTGGLESCDCNALEEATEKVRRCIGCGTREGFISPLNICEKCLKAASQSDGGVEP